jgi:hypothetical protein
MEENKIERLKDHLYLSEDILEDIAERAAEKAIIKMENKLYTEVGKTFLSKIAKIVGMALVALAFYITKGDLTKLFG